MRLAQWLIILGSIIGFNLACWAEEADVEKTEYLSNENTASRFDHACEEK
jgi:hypothetical protein